MKAVEVGSPYINKKIVLSDMELLPEGPIISEGQDVDLQIEDVRPINLILQFAGWDLLIL